jgi:cobalt-zinc-cadmium resistance protein CzcA
LKAEKILKQFPEVIDVVSKTGRADIASDPMGVELSDVIITLKPREEWTTSKSKDELVDKMRTALAELPGVASSFSQPIALRVDELVSGVKSAIGIKIFGDDLDVLKAKGEAVARVLGKVRGATDVNVEKVSGLAYLQIEINRDKIARYGINVADIQNVIETAIGGKEASKVYEGLRAFGLAVRFPEQARNDVEPIKEILIPTPLGALIPLGQVAKVYVSEGPAQISREMAQRRIVIECNVRDRDIGGFVAEAKEKIDAAVKLPTGYLMTWGGQFENQQRAMKRFSIVVPITIAAIFLLLFSSFNSVKQAVLIILNIPFAMVGGIVALVLGHFNLSVSASVGFIALFGVAVLNGVVMVSYFNELRREGMPVGEAVIHGSVLRLRPVLITASVAALGLIPILFATGPGSEIQKPLAAVVIGGLMSSTLLTLFILPTLYNVFERKARPVAHPLPEPPLTTVLSALWYIRTAMNPPVPGIIFVGRQWTAHRSRWRRIGLPKLWSDFKAVIYSGYFVVYCARPMASPIGHESQNDGDFDGQFSQAATEHPAAIYFDRRSRQRISPTRSGWRGGHNGSQRPREMELFRSAIGEAN